MKEKPNWPTLEGRLNQPLTSEKEALEQLQTIIPLSEYGKARLNELQKTSQAVQKKNLRRKVSEKAKNQN